MKFIGGFLFLFFISAGFTMPTNEYDDYDEYSENVAGEQSADDNSGNSAPLPVFIEDPQTFTVQEGETVVIPCRSSDGEGQVLIINKLRMDDPSHKLLIGAGQMLLQNQNRTSIKDSMITIEKVRRQDTGMYECSFQNDGEQKVTLTHTLNVLFESSIRRKQKSIDANKGETVKLMCGATGNPKPKITWKKQDSEMPSEAMEEEGISITFEEADRNTTGSYICTADNGVGSAVTGVRDVTIYYAPEIVVEKERLHTGDGDRIELVCIVYAFPTAEIEWLLNGTLVDSDTIAEVYQGGHRHVLTLDSVSQADFGLYECIATNQHGASFKHIFVTDAPSAPNVTSDQNSSKEDRYTLTWTTESFYPIVHYNLQYRKSKVNDSTDLPGEWFDIEEHVTVEQESGVQKFTKTLKDLERASDYEGKINVQNSKKSAQPVEFAFSTRKETAGHISTSSAQTNALVSAALMISICALNFVL